MKFKKKPAASSPKNSKASTGRGLLTIDITDQNVKIAHISGRSPEQLVLENYKIFPIPQGYVQDGKINNEEQFTVILQQACSQFKGSGKQVVAALPHNVVTTQNFSYTLDSGTTLEDAANFEAAQIATIEEVDLDYQVINTASDSEEVLMVIALKSDTKPYLDCLEEAGFGIPKFLDVEPYAIVNAFSNWINTQSPDLENQILAIFDIGSLKTQCLIVQAGKVLFKQEVLFGGEQLTREIQRNYQVDQEGAEKIKVSSEQPIDYEEFTVSGYNQELAMEIQRVLQFFYTSSHSNGKEKINKILLTGGSAVLPNLSKVVEEQCTIDTVVVNPLQFLGIASHIDPLSLVQDAGRLTVCCGLAVRGVA
ncbi:MULTISPECIES: type IV pilus assembly protein PilM [Vitreoscilla]|uniref:Pilus assembly protein PilM n=1 Tax=Vitreoscilla stercoraria TaxID=61 RepID=A0ABY4EC88_VITST|nr:MULTISPECIES: type IV pilus assembly protein PilM [Vitreoscilla]QJQ52352.1 type 4 pilus assembly protein PilM [Vitreoscilla sp. C1]UOO92968.1 pilus assembly protein PilM [Vitreoscilla stercoraria]